jgi:hypothetical protein
MINSEIDSQGFLESARMKAMDFTRKRNLPFPLLCLFLLRTVRECLSIAFAKFTENIAETISMTEQSLSEARNKIRWEAFAELSGKVGRFAYSGDYETWNGYRLWAIDGTKIALPNIPSLRIQFGDEKGSPMARGSILYDVLNYTIFDAHIEPLSVDERTLAKRHVDALKKGMNDGKDMIINDRGYPSEDMIGYYESNSIKYLMRVRRKFNADVDAVTGNEGFVQIGRYTVRVIKVALDTGEIEVLLTNLTESVDFKVLYFCRWGVEKEYDVLKNALEIENFSGQSETAIKQDFYAHIIASNMLVASYWEAQELVNAELNTNPKNKHEYKVNVSQAAGIFKSYIVRVILAKTEREREQLLAEMHERMARAVVPIRPNRIVPRKKNNRASKFKHNRKSNL